MWVAQLLFAVAGLVATGYGRDYPGGQGRKHTSKQVWNNRNRGGGPSKGPRVGQKGREQRDATGPSTPRFPAHWGELPKRQSRDHVELPGGYGEGSSSIRRWIKENMVKDKEGGAGSNGNIHDGADANVAQKWDATRDPRFESTVCNIDRIPIHRMTKAIFESKYEG